MKGLKELVSIISKQKVNAVRLIEKEIREESMLGKLYIHISEEPSCDDIDAAIHLYGYDNKIAYKKLKERLKRRLQNNLFFLDLNQMSYNQFQEAYYNSWKDFAAAKVLMGKAAHKSSSELLLKVLKVAKRFDFTELSRESARELRKYYANIQMDHNKFKKYNKVFKHYAAIYEAETKVEELYMSLVSLSGGKNKSKAYSFAIEYYNSIKDLLDEFDAYKIHLLGRMMLLLHYTSNKQHQEVVKICDDAVSFFEHKNISLTSVQVFLHQQLMAYIQLKKFDKGKESALKNIDISEGYNLVESKRLYLKLCLHTMRYDEANRILSEIVRSREFHEFPEHLKETWLIHKAYIFYLISLNKITLPSTSKKFRLGKFLNEVPEFSKDKRGMNIPILIIQILFLIHRKKHDDAINRIESLQWYGAKHIRKDENFRTNCFIKMLSQLPKAGFMPKRVERHAEKYKQKLLSMPIDKADQAFEIEVIPYEDLWELVVESLDLDSQAYKK